MTPKLSIALEPHCFADASPAAPRDLGAIAALGFAARPWLVIEGAVDAIGWSQRSVTALVGMSIIPGRIWEHR